MRDKKETLMDPKRELTPEEEKFSALLAGAYPGRTPSSRLERRIALQAAAAESGQGSCLGSTPGSVVGGGRLTQLRLVADHFPRYPAAQADVIRYSTTGPVGFHRWEEDRLMDQPVAHESAPSTADLAGFDRAAAQGERLDPENAYFPLMRCV